MPMLSRFFIRAALVHMLLGLTFGALILANKGTLFAPLAWALLPAHIELMFTGWLTQLALGVAYWILPRFAGSQPRGDERWGWSAFWLVNIGLLLYLLSPYLGVAWVGLGARSFQVAGLIAFVAGNWRRIYPLVRNFPGPSGLN